MARLFGYVPDPEGTAAILADEWSPGVREWVEVDDAQMGVYQPYQGPDTIVLLDALLALVPHWKRGAQGIGDCVSWGWELGCSTAIAVDIIHRQEPWEWPGIVATEPIYGGSRVEARGGRPAGYSDGSYGAAAAKWVTDWGVLHRINYGAVTGEPDHDLRQYSAKRAKDWGNYGCGGDRKPKALDEIAATRPVTECPKVTSWEQYVRCIESGYPVAICSMQGLGRRDDDGFANPRGTWAHCMLGGGIKTEGREGGLIVNSWGNSWGTKAPLPGVESAEIKKCSAWVDAKVVDRMLKAGDSFAITAVEGLKRREIDWEKIWHINGRS